MEVGSNSGSSSEEEVKKSKKSKKSKHKKHKTKEKRHKKSKKHHRRHSSSSSESSSDEEAWIEAGEKKKVGDEDAIMKSQESVPISRQSVKESSKVDEDEWSSFGNMIPTFSNDSKRNARRKERQEEKLLNSIDKAGQHDKELNPYWKDGGIGIPTEVEVEERKVKSHSAVGDGGLAWLRKSFQRAKEQAKEDGRSLEDVVSERWGSLEKFYSLLEEAEGKNRKTKESEHSQGDKQDYSRSHKSSNRFKRPSRYSDSEDDDNRRRNNSKSDLSPPSHFSSSRRHREREQQEKNPSWMKPNSAKRKLHITNDEIIKPKMNVSHTISQKQPTPMEDFKEDEQQEEIEKPHVLTDKEMNELNAKLFKAEMLGNTDLVLSLKNKLLEAEKARVEFIKGGGEDSIKTKVITKVIMGSEQRGGRRTKDKITETHKDGQRIRYFPDDDKYTLKTMFEREKINTVEDENALFSRLAGKGAKASSEYDADDIFVDKASSSKQDMKEREREVKKALDDDKQYSKVLDDCSWCFDGKRLQKNLVVAIGQSSFLCVPPYQSLTDGHCLIVPMFHVTCSTQLDEDVWTEMQKFRKALIQMFRNSEQDVIFFETALSLNKQPHMYIECVPMPIETGEMAPIYFKKAIQECETEWSQNKKVVDLRDRDVRKAIPKGLPYFSVEFADDTCGFAHVVEDERNFPKNFAQEIVGGMLELDHQIWRKQKKDDFHKQRAKLMSFLKLWAPYDWTREESSSIKV